MSQEEEASAIASRVIELMDGAGIHPHTPKLGAALVIVGLTLAKSVSDAEASLAFRAAVNIATKAGVVPPFEAFRDRMRNDPKALAEFVGKVLGAKVEAVEVAQAPEPFHRPRRKFPWR